MNIHIHHHNINSQCDLKIIKESLLIIIKNQQKNMGQLDGIAASLTAAQAKLDDAAIQQASIASGIAALNTTIQGLGSAPSAAEIAAVQSQSDALNTEAASLDTSLQADSTAANPVTPAPVTPAA